MSELQIELSPIELDELMRQELVIERGLKTFYEVGEALATIREKKLYRETYGTFEDYCQNKWGINSSRARQLIYGANVVDNLKSVTNVTLLPRSESQVRPLTTLKPDQQREAWEHTLYETNGEQPTAKQVDEVVKKYKEAEYSYIPESQAMKLLSSSANDAWRTPFKYIDAARQVMGTIYLDPASSVQANEFIKAENFFTKEEDGLSHLWEGKVWCNPPYGKTNGKSNQGLFAHKLLKSYQDGLVNEGIILLNLYFGYEWFTPLRELPMCFVDHRIAFINPDTDEAGDEAKASSVFIYVGNKPNRFFYIFKEFGPCAQPTYDW